MHLKNLWNPYAAQLGPLLEECPKAVLAAIAVSFGTNGGDFLEHAATAIAREWRTLHRQGIVPQAPGKAARAADDGRPHGDPFGPPSHNEDGEPTYSCGNAKGHQWNDQGFCIHCGADGAA